MYKFMTFAKKILTKEYCKLKMKIHYGSGTNKRSGNLNISDIAAKAGVSVSTVSRVINKSPNVNDETRRRILKVMEETGYVPSSIARNMMSKSNRTIGLFITDILNPFFSEIIKGVENVVNAEGYSLLIYAIGNSLRKEEESLNKLIRDRACGLIVTSCRLHSEKFVERAQKYFNIVSIQSSLDNVDNIGATDEKGTCDMIRYLIGLGHSQISVMGYDETLPTSDARFAGFKKAMADAELSVNDNQIIRVEPGEGNCYQAALELLLRQNRPTAIHCLNEYIASEVYRAIKDVGLSIPQDISLTGFDNLFISELMEPKLTTVSQPIRQMGEVAAKCVIRRHQYPDEEIQNIVFPTKLIIRDSAAVPYDAK